jgi:hypothetical protein
LGAFREGDVIERDHRVHLLIRRGGVPTILAPNDELAAHY